MNLRGFHNRIKHSSESKNLLTNFVSLTLLQVASYVFPLLTIPYLAHVIGVDKYGEISFALAIMIYFQTIVDYGFVFSAVRDIARCRDDISKVSEIYSNVMWSRLVLVIISFSILFFLTLLIPKLHEMNTLLYASFLMVIGQAMFPDWIFQALEKMKYITIFNIVIKLLFTAAVFVFIKKPSDYILQPILTSFGYIVSGIGAMILIWKWGIKFNSPKLKEIRITIVSNFDLFLNQIIPNLYNSASILLLGFFHGNAANGIYDAANRFNTAGGSFFTIISRTFYPFLSRRMDKHHFFQYLNIGSALLMALLLFVFAPFIIDTFFPESFFPARNVLRIISISLIFLAMNNVYGTNYLIIAGYEKKMRQITMYSSIIGFAIAIPLVYFYSFIGAALTITISRAILGIWSMREANLIQNKNKIII